MKHVYLTLALTVLSGLLFAFGAGGRTAEAQADAEAQQGAETQRGAKGGKKLYHVVSIKFKPDATREQIRAVEEAFVGLKQKIPGITSVTWGTNVSPEKHDKGFTHCFILTFASEKDRDAYLPHPDHKAFGKVLGPVLADVFVIDFWGE